MNDKQLERLLLNVRCLSKLQCGIDIDCMHCHLSHGDAFLP